MSSRSTSNILLTFHLIISLLSAQSPTTTTNSPTDVTKLEKEKYGLHGTWNHYNPSDDISIQINLATDYYCQYVKFTAIIPACQTTDIWVGFGIGGDYDIVSSDDGDDVLEAQKMNGYALITINNNFTFETTLSPGDRPKPQTQQDLYDCSITIDNCVQTTICYRELFNDDDEDFDEFVVGDNYIIWAYGKMVDGQMKYHGDENAEADLQDKIYLEGDKVCVNNNESELDGNGNGNGKVSVAWMIIAIVFMILFVLVSVVMVIGYFRMKNKITKEFIHGNEVSTGSGVVGQSELIGDDVVDDDDGGNGNDYKTKLYKGK